MAEEIISRHRPLHTCVVSILAIIHTASSKAQENNGPVGILAKWISKPMSIVLPLVYAIQYQCLAILCFADDWILEFEKLAERIFPPLTLLFDKVDAIVSTAEIILERFDDALNNRCPVNLHRASFIEWAFSKIVWGLDLNRKEEEKEIMMDMNSSSVTEWAAAEDANCPPGQESIPEPVKKPETLSEKDKNTVEESSDIDADPGKESAGDVRGKSKSKTKTSGEKKIGDVRGKNKNKTSGVKTESSTDEKERKKGKDPVLELFESKWLI